MGRPPLNNLRTHVNLDPEALARIDALAGVKGRSKFIRAAVEQMLGEVAPARARPPYFASSNGATRLTSGGTAAVLHLIRKSGWDAVTERFGIKDPAEFLQALLGHRDLPTEAVRYLVAQRISDNL